MRVHIFPSCPSSAAVAGLLSRAGFRLSDWFPYVQLDLVVDAQIDQIIVDGSGGALEMCIVWGICELARQHQSAEDIVLRRVGGEVHDDKRLRILMPDDDKIQAIVEYGVVRGMARFRKEANR